MTNMRKMRVVGIAVLAGSILAGCSSSPGSSGTTTTTSAKASNSVASATSPSTAPQGSPAADAVYQAIAASTSITSIPASLTPPLSSFANPAQAKPEVGTDYFHSCDPYDDPALAADPSPCIFGDPQGTKTVVLVGDSNVGNWAPALDQGLKAAGYRLAVFGFAGCPTPDIHYSSYSGLTAAQVADCNAWHSSAPKAISALAPVAVVVASGAADLVGISDSQWFGGFKTLFDLSTQGDPTAARILIGTSPFPGPSPNCVAAHPNPQGCSLDLSSATAWSGYATRDKTIAKVAGADLLPSQGWMCHGETCSPIVSHYLVFFDQDHLTTAYSEFISPVVTEAVLGAIPST